MITFITGIAILLAGYSFYSKVLEKIFGTDENRLTPVHRLNDGIDYVPMGWGKIFLIQFLNIAGLGPIFGAVAGAMWGPVAFLWIVVGCVFGGAMHDYFSGMLSIKHNGLSLPEIVGKYLGIPVKQLMRAFTLILMLLVGAVFIKGPAAILTDMTGGFLTDIWWVWIILAYYLLATLFPVDKIIGRVYPVFGFALIFMALGILAVLVTGNFQIPELNLANFANLRHHPEKFPIMPMLFISIACGAISGFHATQSPLMARCLKNETNGRRVFYGAMIAEGIVAMIWAAAAMAFFNGVEGLNTQMEAHGQNAAWAVNLISNSMLGKIGGILALLGVVAAPITSGDTAFRSARLIAADIMNFKQSALKNRLILTIPLLILGFSITLMKFDIIWRYFAWANQTLSVFVLWTITSYLISNKKFYWISLIPAIFMTTVVVMFIMVSPQGFQQPQDTSLYISLFFALVSSVACAIYSKKKLQPEVIKSM